MQKIRKRNHRKLNWKHVAMLLGTLVVVVAILVGVWKLWFHHPYEKYDVYNKESKLTGTMEHTSKEEDIFYQSMYYPEFKEKELNDLVKDFMDKELLKNTNKEGMQYLMVDYDSEKLFDHYVTLTFHQKIVDENDKVIAKKDISYNYDVKNKKVMGVHDVVRRDYLKLIEKKAKEQKLDVKELRSKQLHNFVLGKKDVTFYFNQDMNQKIVLNYKENDKYIALIDTNIPSLYKGEEITSKPVSVDKNKKMIAITFDDGPHYQNTQEIMDVFEKYQGRATFFMLGKNVEYNQDIVKDMAKRGFEVANHSWDHPDMRILSKEELTKQLYHTQDAIYQLTGKEPKYFRPPYGAVNHTLLEMNQMGYAFWDVDSSDWRLKEPNAIKNHVIKQTKAGNYVVLLHDIHEFSKNSVGKILETLSKEGYQFVTYSTLVEYEKDYLDQLGENYGVPKEIVNGK